MGPPLLDCFYSSHHNWLKKNVMVSIDGGLISGRPQDTKFLSWHLPSGIPFLQKVDWPWSCWSFAKLRRPACIPSIGLSIRDQGLAILIIWLVFILQAANLFYLDVVYVLTAVSGTESSWWDMWPYKLSEINTWLAVQLVGFYFGSENGVNI